jgi:GDP-mannose 6-dehydrogenase
MRLSILGLGYVGVVSAACFAKRGHEVIGADVNPTKVEIINAGKSPIVEPGIEELITDAVKQGKLRATVDAEEAVMNSDVSIVCVGTPSQQNGSLDLTYVKRVCQQIGTAIEKKKTRHTVVIRSTMLPGTIHDVVIPTLEVYSSKKAVTGFGIVINPEFLRESTSIYDFDNPPFTLIGSDDEESAELVKRLYADLQAPVYVTRVKEAEMVKYSCNAFHAAKVVFANEIGNLCKKLGVDSHPVMEVFCKDTKLNLSPYYLKPGFAYGGSCLPKDVRAIVYKARSVDLETPLLSSLNQSNRLQIEMAIEKVLASKCKQVGILGMSFKSGTDDLREAPMVMLIEALIGKGIKLAIYDKDVELARLFGANKEYIEREIPHISSLMKPTLAEVIEGAEFIIIGKKEAAYRDALRAAKPSTTIFDLVRLGGDVEAAKGYDGLSW